MASIKDTIRDANNALVSGDEMAFKKAIVQALMAVAQKLEPHVESAESEGDSIRQFIDEIFYSGYPENY